MTVTAWINLRTSSSNTGKQLVNDHNLGLSNSNGWNLELSPANSTPASGDTGLTFNAWAANGTGQGAVSSAFLTAGKWVFVAATFSPGRVVTFYAGDTAASVSQVGQSGALSNGGNLYAWMTHNLAVERGTLERRLRRLRPVSTGLTFVPLLAGERSPGFASHATGSIAGLTQATTATDIVRAGLEAIAIEFGRVDRLLDAVLPGARRLVANGAGLLASPAWMQIMADAIGKPVAESKAKEASARGAAILALEHLGAINGDRLRSEVGRTYHSEPEAHAAYQVQTARQEELYRLLVRERALDAILKAPPPTGGRR